MNEQKCRNCKNCDIGWPEEGEDYCSVKGEYLKKDSTAEDNDCDKWIERE